MPRRRSERVLFWGIIAGIIVADLITKRIAVAQLVPRYVAHPVIGDWVQLRLVYNQGAAFGIYLGEYSRWIFIGLTIVAVVLLGRMFAHTAEGHRARIIALAMVIGGALGNLIDRVRSAQGVVDFIDVGIGVHRWPTFNVADMGVSIGAVLLAIVLWQEDEAAARAGAPAPAPAGPERSA
ncbi:MAG TPA: signal peptidase II [Gemmatimonadaceae bacterium]|nr:signal peptidase II [Gemmatimonadaceae bacterium]